MTIHADPNTKEFIILYRRLDPSGQKAVRQMLIYQIGQRQAQPVAADLEEDYIVADFRKGIRPKNAVLFFLKNVLFYIINRTKY